MNWLESVFHRYTKDRAGRARRLLIVDSHSSHVNLQFIALCDKLRILLLVLPPHTTHRLQPLDVSLFAPLARFYTNALDELVSKSLGIVSISKRAFWRVFRPVWNKAFIPKKLSPDFKGLEFGPTILY